METLLIHDLTPKQLSAVLPDTSGYTIIDANRSAAFCQGRVHHPLRYQNRHAFLACFYGAATDFERETATRLANANRVNLGFSSARVCFAEKPELLAEVIENR